MTCSTPIPFETFVDLWTRELADAESIEEHIFSCDDCAAASAKLDRLIGSLMHLVPPVLTRAMRERFEARGLKILEVPFEAGARGEAVFARELDLLVFALHAELANAQRVDLEILDGTGRVHFSFANIPFDAARGEVLVACQQHFRDYPAEGDPEFRLHVVEGGTRRQIAAYVIKHVWP